MTLGTEHDEQAQAFCGERQQSHLLRRVGKLKLFTNTTVLLFSIAGWKPDLLPRANTSGDVNCSSAWWGCQIKFRMVRSHLKYR